MSTLLLRLAGPMQSWGTQSRFGHRDTGLEPSKSGVIGLLCCALGWQRESESFPLKAGSMTLEAFSRGLAMCVRVDREGRMSRDFQTAQDVIRSDRSGRAETVLSERYYLADADFVIGFSSENQKLLDELGEALRAPVWPLYLGRKSFVASRPILIGVVEADLLHAIVSVSVRRRATRDDGAVRLVVETTTQDGADVRQDVPLCFGYQRRRFTTRRVKTLFLPDAALGLAMPPADKEDA